MRKAMWAHLTIWTCVSVLFSVTGQAQIAVPFKKTEGTVKPNQNPFDFVQDIVENSGQYNQDTGQDSAAQYSAKPKFGAPLKYHKNDSGSLVKAQVIYNALVQEYGLPKSVRGQSHVWDIKNPGKSGTQADIITVILKMGNSGAYELIMDRDRGENGRATWDATRVKKASAKLQGQQKQKTAKPFLVLQEDND